MTDIPRRITPGDVVQISRILRKQKKSLEERGRDLVALLADLDRQGLDVVISVRRKRGRPSNISRFLARQHDLPIEG